MEENKQVEITFKITFLGKEPVEITIKGESPIACRVSAIRKANLDFPAWFGIKEINK